MSAVEMRKSVTKDQMAKYRKSFEMYYQENKEQYFQIESWDKEVNFKKRLFRQWLDTRLLLECYRDK